MKSSTSENQVAIKLVGVTKQYVIHHEKPTLVEKFVKGRDETFTALNNINLTIKKGEKVGIIGPNGSGKTTLLKVIADITTPTSGNIRTQGRIVSLIDLEAGFHPDLSGYQNIYMNGIVMGMKKSEINQKIQSIINFANLKQFIDIPIYMYSEGMKLRLGFSIAIHANPDILILDEALAVGDKEFKIKAEHQMKFFAKEKTLVFSSHFKTDVKKYCKRIISLQRGKIIEDASLNHCKKYFKYLA